MKVFAANKHSLLLLIWLLVALAATAQDDGIPQEESAAAEPVHCDAICADRVDQAVTPLRDGLAKLQDELDFVVRDRNELKSAHETALQQRQELQNQVNQANERSDGLGVRVNELERDLSATKSERDAVKGQLAVALVELDVVRSKVGFFGRLQDEIKQWYGAAANFLNKLFKKKGDDEL